MLRNTQIAFQRRPINGDFYRAFFNFRFSQLVHIAPNITIFVSRPLIYFFFRLRSARLSRRPHPPPGQNEHRTVRPPRNMVAPADKFLHPRPLPVFRASLARPPVSPQSVFSAFPDAPTTVPPESSRPSPHRHL